MITIKKVLTKLLFPNERYKKHLPANSLQDRNFAKKRCSTNEARYEKSKAQWHIRSTLRL
jgi:hypothetical protein